MNNPWLQTESKKKKRETKIKLCWKEIFAAPKNRHCGIHKIYCNLVCHTSLKWETKYWSMILILTYYIRVWHESGVIFLFKTLLELHTGECLWHPLKFFVSRSLLMYLVRSSVGLLEMPRDWKFSSAIDREFATSLAASFDIFKMVFPFHPDWDWPLGAQNENKNFVYPSTCVHGNMNHARGVVSAREG